ncbi:MAG: glycosyltransferase family 39 protein [Oscillospiraceae bacterium]|nr:glycosyltransferase family 39 protein [Oscillospiraceae bacterium]
MLTNILISLTFCAVCTFFYYYVERKNRQDRPAISRRIFVALLVLAAAVRIFFALQDQYFTYDVDTFKAWGSYANFYKFSELYSQDIFLDYPPGYIYVLSILDEICTIFGFASGSTMATFVFKMPSMIFDFACAALIFSEAKRHLNEDMAKFLSLVFLFMPAVIYNSSVWGQVESFYLFFIALSISFAARDRVVPAAVSYAYALITKPQALMFGLVLLLFIIKRRSIKKFLLAVTTGAVSFYIMAIPFCQDIFNLEWLFSLYRTTMEGYRYFTVNSYNIYYFLGLNWLDISSARFGNINLWVIAVVIILASFTELKSRKHDNFFTVSTIIATTVFTFCTMMHERYIYPAILLSLIAFAKCGKKPYLAFSLAACSINFFNAACVMSMYFGNFAIYPNIEKAASLVLVAIDAVFIVWQVYDTARENDIHIRSFFTPQRIAVIATVMYAFVAFTGLGSTTAPQSYFMATDDEMSLTVKFDDSFDLETIYVYSGLGDEDAKPDGRKVCGEFDLTWSNNGKKFRELTAVEDLSVYTWKEISCSAQGVTHIKITARQPGDILHEIVFVNSDGEIMTGTVVDATTDRTQPYHAYLAFDEQELAPKDTSYYYSMYFDEIYHGRTAYEQLEGYSVYETTHPPLGKILIGIGIKLFGMTPFGWRFAGAVCGVVMLAVIWHMTKAIAGCNAAMVACVLMAVDFMHLTQTRIATVDSFVVLFVMLTFLFMIYYHKTEFGNAEKEWLFLALSGVFMACAVASKWNGAYPMVALAVFFFISLYTKYKNSAKTRRDRNYVLRTLAFCVIAFVSVPVVIYTLCYIPVVKAEGIGDFLSQVIRCQGDMYRYHANLEAEHFFSSMWYSWPLCLKPMWYSVANLSNGWISTISAFGNPLVWIATPVAAVCCLYEGIRNKKYLHLLVGMGYIASYLPWMFVTRLCFIYHYFPCAMFGIVAIALVLENLTQKSPAAKKYITVYLAACAVLFVVFLPVTTGWGASYEYIQFLELLPEWFFVN